MSANLRNNATVAHVASLTVFVLLSSLIPFFTIRNSALPWWRSAPEHWVYPLQSLVCGGLLLFFWKNYSFKPGRGFVLATVLGVAAIGVWILPAHLYHRFDVQDSDAKAGIWWLGFVGRFQGFDPFIFPAESASWWTTVILRFLRLVIVVPLVEEIFWRGFLMRWLVAGDEKPFTAVPFGTHTWKAFGITTVAFMLVHAKEDWLGALFFGSLMYWLCVRTKSLAACVWMHAVANLLLGIYVLKTRQWGFW